MKKAVLIIVFSIIFNFGSQSFADAPNLSDTESSKIDLVSLSNRNIEVSKGESDLLVTITASDNLNNIAEVYFGIYRAANPFPVQVNLFPIQVSTKPISTSVINNRVVSVFQFKITIPKGLASGDYYIYTFAKDAIGNFPQTGSCDKYCSPAEMPRNLESTFAVKNDSTGKVIDVTQFDLAVQIKTLQASYDLLLASNKALAANYENALATKAKSDADLKSTLALAEESNKKFKALEDAKQIALNDAIKLRDEMDSLNSGNKNLQSQLTSATKKLTSICKPKPKPKGC